MKTVRYTHDAIRDLKRHGNMAERIMRAVAEFAADPRAHANNVKSLVGTDTLRLRVGTYRAVFIETEAEIIVVKIAPRGDVYD
jgi:mRNA interferase RelE/StbE